jgi:hypothetical protein
MSEPTIRQIAARIRGELNDLLGSDAASALVELDASLEEEDDDRVLAVLARREPTRERLDELLAGGLAGERGFSPTPGIDGRPPDALIYRCPKGDYEWPAYQVGEVIPACPNHHIALALVESPHYA